MLRTLVVGLAALSLSACLSVLPKPEPPDGLYRFGPMVAQYTLQASLVVREPEASRLFAGRAIAAEDSSGALRLVRGVEWSDRATRQMQAAMLDLLHGEGEGAAILPGTGAPADYELSWQVTDFTLSGTTGRCRIRATLLDGRSREVLAQYLTSTSAEADGSSNADRARALAAAGQACVRDVAAFVAEHARPASEET